MRALIVTSLLLIISPKLFCQIGPPSLSVGADKVLFEKGVIDVDILAELIQEKQNEVKQEFTKRLILNKKLESGPFTTYSYADQLLSTLLDHKNKSVIKKQILEKTAELAIVLGIGEAYLRIRTEKKEELITEYIKFLEEREEKLDTDLIKLDPYNRNISQTNFGFKEPLPTTNGNYLTKISELYKLKLYGEYSYKKKECKNKATDIKTNLAFIYLDLVNEVCRNNEGLQKLGFFQTQFDELGFRNKSHYELLKSNFTSKSSLITYLDGLKEELNKIITINLKYASTILNEPITLTLDVLLSTDEKTELNKAFVELKEGIKNRKDDLTKDSYDEIMKLLNSRILNNDSLNKSNGYSILANKLRDLLPNDSAKEILNQSGIDKIFSLQKIDSITTQINTRIIQNNTKQVYEKLIVLDIDTLKINEEDQKTISKLSELAYFGIRNLRLQDSRRDYDSWVISIQSILPKLMSLNTKTKNKFSDIIKSLEVLSSAILNQQLKNFQTEMGNVIEGDKINNINDRLASLFKILTNLDQAESYDQIAKLVVDIGNIFRDGARSKLLSNLANIQAYFVVDTEENRVNIQVEELIYFLGEEYINNASGPVAFYFTVGFNYGLASQNPQVKDFSFASEKVGLKLNLVNFEKQSIQNSKKVFKNKRPIVSQMYVLGYASGLLYQIDQLKSENDVIGSNVGFAVGTHLFNGLDFAVSYSRVKLQENKTRWLLGTSFDIPITEYLAKLSKRNKEKSKD